MELEGDDTCMIVGCDRPIRAKGVCSAHYQRLRSGQSMTDPIKIKHNGESCAINGCDLPAAEREFCSSHAQRVRRGWSADRIADPVRGIFDDHWGEWKVNANGYVVRARSRGPRNARVRQEQKQHRFVMEQELGRELLPTEEVHHLNGVRHDNRPENLELWTTSQPKGQRVSDKIVWAIEFLEQYGYTARKEV